MVESVLFGEKVPEIGVIGQRRLVEKPDVPARAKRAERAGFALPTQGHGQYRRILTPSQKRLCERAHHVQRQGIEGLGAVECEAGHTPTQLSQNGVGHVESPESIIAQFVRSVARRVRRAFGVHANPRPR